MEDWGIFFLAWQSTPDWALPSLKKPNTDWTACHPHPPYHHPPPTSPDKNLFVVSSAVCLRSVPLLIVKDAEDMQQHCVLKGRGTAQECGLGWMSAAMHDRQIMYLDARMKNVAGSTQCFQGVWLLKSYPHLGLQQNTQIWGSTNTFLCAPQGQSGVIYELESMASKALWVSYFDIVNSPCLGQMV